MPNGFEGRIHKAERQLNFPLVPHAQSANNPIDGWLTLKEARWGQIQRFVESISIFTWQNRINIVELRVFDLSPRKYEEHIFPLPHPTRKEINAPCNVVSCRRNEAPIVYSIPDLGDKR